MPRVMIALIFGTITLVIYMVIAPIAIDPLVEAFLRYEWMQEHASTYDNIQTIMYRWVPVVWFVVLVSTGVIWYVRRRRGMHQRRVPLGGGFR